VEVKIMVFRLWGRFQIQRTVVVTNTVNSQRVSVVNRQIQRAFSVVVLLVEGVQHLPQGEEERVPHHQAGHHAPQLPRHNLGLGDKQSANHSISQYPRF
jgi:hypothetical protein